MSNITKIEGSSCQRYNNALHVGFHQHILVIFETLLSDVLAKLHISVDLLNSYKKSIDQESELNRKSLASTLTRNRLPRQLPNGWMSCSVRIKESRIRQMMPRRL